MLGCKPEDIDMDATMKEIDEDSTLTQLTLGFIDLAQVRTPARPDLSFPHCCPDLQSCFTGWRTPVPPRLAWQ